jgi:hypothetical protein
MQIWSRIIVGALVPLADSARSETAYRALFGVLFANGYFEVFLRVGNIPHCE